MVRSGSTAHRPICPSSPTPSHENRSMKRYNRTKVWYTFRNHRRMPHGLNWTKSQCTPQSFKTFCSWQRLSLQSRECQRPKMSIAQIACAHTPAPGLQLQRERGGVLWKDTAIAHNSRCRWWLCGTKTLTKLMCQISSERRTLLRMTFKLWQRT